jgi:hypothetical protein
MPSSARNEMQKFAFYSSKNNINDSMRTSTEDQQFNFEKF